MASLDLPSKSTPGYCWLQWFEDLREYRVLPDYITTEFLVSLFGAYPRVRLVLGYIYSHMSHDVYIHNVDFGGRGLHVEAGHSVVLLSQLVSEFMFSNMLIGATAMAFQNPVALNNISASTGSTLQKLCSLGGIDAGDTTRRIIQTQMHEKNSLIRNQLEEAFVTHVRNTANLRDGCPKLKLPYCVSALEESNIENAYPEFCITFGRGGHAHAVAANLRVCELNLLLLKHQHTPRYAIDSVPICEGQEWSFPFIDVGGEWTFYASRAIANVHSCVYVGSDLRDSARETRRMVTLGNLRGSGIAKAVYSQFTTPGPTALRCCNKAQDCPATAPYLMFCHSTYNMSIEVIGSILDKKGCLIAQVCLIFDPDIFIKDKGVIKDNRCYFEKFVEKGVKYIRFQFLADNSLTYVHRYDTYISLITTSVIITPCAVVYSSEIVDTRMGCMYLTFTRASGSFLPSRSERCLWFPSMENTTVISTWVWEVDTLTTNPRVCMRRETFFAPTALVDKIKNHAYSCTDTKFTVKDIFNVARSYNTRQTVNGQEFTGAYNVPADELFLLVAAVYVSAYEKKYTAGRAVQHMTEDLKRRREAGGRSFLRKVVDAINEYCRSKSLKCTDFINNTCMFWAKLPELFPVGLEEAAKFTTFVDYVRCSDSSCESEPLFLTVNQGGSLLLPDETDTLKRTVGSAVDDALVPPVLQGKCDDSSSSAGSFASPPAKLDTNRGNLGLVKQDFKPSAPPLTPPVARPTASLFAPPPVDNASFRRSERKSKRRSIAALAGVKRYSVASVCSATCLKVESVVSTSEHACSIPDQYPLTNVSGENNACLYNAIIAAMRLRSYEVDGMKLELLNSTLRDPMDAELYSMLTLPNEMGGYGVLQLVCNHFIQPICLHVKLEGTRSTVVKFIPDGGSRIYRPSIHLYLDTVQKHYQYYSVSDPLDRFVAYDCDLRVSYDDSLSEYESMDVSVYESKLRVCSRFAVLSSDDLENLMIVEIHARLFKIIGVSPTLCSPHLLPSSQLAHLSPHLSGLGGPSPRSVHLLDLTTREAGDDDFLVKTMAHFTSEHTTLVVAIPVGLTHMQLLVLMRFKAYSTSSKMFVLHSDLVVRRVMYCVFVGFKYSPSLNAFNNEPTPHSDEAVVSQYADILQVEVDRFSHYSAASVASPSNTTQITLDRAIDQLFDTLKLPRASFPISYPISFRAGGNVPPVHTGVELEVASSLCTPDLTSGSVCASVPFYPDFKQQLPLVVPVQRSISDDFVVPLLSIAPVDLTPISGDTVGVTTNITLDLSPPVTVVTPVELESECILDVRGCGAKYTPVSTPDTSHHLRVTRRPSRLLTYADPGRLYFSSGSTRTLRYEYSETTLGLMNVSVPDRVRSVVHERLASIAEEPSVVKYKSVKTFPGRVIRTQRLVVDAADFDTIPETSRTVTISPGTKSFRDVVTMTHECVEDCYNPGEKVSDSTDLPVLETALPDTLNDREGSAHSITSMSTVGIERCAEYVEGLSLDQVTPIVEERPIVFPINMAMEVITSVKSSILVSTPDVALNGGELHSADFVVHFVNNGILNPAGKPVGYAGFAKTVMNDCVRGAREFRSALSDAKAALQSDNGNGCVKYPGGLLFTAGKRFKIVMNLPATAGNCFQVFTRDMRQLSVFLASEYPGRIVRVAIPPLGQGLFGRSPAQLMIALRDVTSSCTNIKFDLYADEMESVVTAYKTFFQEEPGELQIHDYWHMSLTEKNRWRDYQPKYLAGNDTLTKMMNAFIEVVESWRRSDASLAHSLSLFYDNHIKYVNTVTPSLHSTLRTNRYALVDTHNDIWVHSPDSRDYGYQYCFDGERFREMDMSDTRHPRVMDRNQCPRYVLLTDDTRLMNDTTMYNAAKSRNITDIVIPEVEFVNAVPGAGKTYTMVNQHSIATKEYAGDLCVTTTREAAEDVRRRVKPRYVNSGCEEKFMQKVLRRNYRTIDSYNLHGSSQHDNVYVDEAIMSHAGTIVLLILKAKPKKIVLFGDIHQIPHINRDGTITMKHQLLTEFCEVTSTMSLSRRIPVDVAARLSPLYPGGVQSVNTDKISTVQVKLFTSISDIPKLENCKYLTYKKSEKGELIKAGFQASTIHEFQGKEERNVIVVRTSTKQKEELYMSSPHAVVAISRHRDQFLYITPVMDDALATLCKRTPTTLELRNSMVDLHGGGNFDQCRVVNTLPLFDRSSYYSNSIMEHDYDAVIDGVAGDSIPSCSLVPEYTLDNCTFPDPPRQSMSFEDPVPVVQGWYDSMLPGNSTHIYDYDQHIVETSDLELFLDGVRVDTCMRKPAIKTYDTMKPEIRTSMSASRDSSYIEVLLALIKRNLNVPELGGCSDDVLLLNIMLERFFVTYFTSENLNMIDQIAYDSPIVPNAVAVDEWYRGQKGVPFEQLLLEEPLHETPLNRYNYMIKKTVKPILDYTAPFQHSALQTISFSEKNVNAVFCPMFREIKKRLLSFLSEKFMLFTDVSPQEFEDELSNRFLSQNLLLEDKLEIDISKYDKSQGLLALLFECEVYKRFGMPTEYVQLWFNAHKNTILNDRQNHITAYVDYQRKSGDASTYLGNTIFLMGVIASLYDITTVRAALFSGDDSVLFGGEITEARTQECAMLFNLESKFFRYKHPYFCSKFIIYDGLKYYLIPDPLKLVTKLGRRDLVNADHVEQYRISLCDLLSNYSNPSLYAQISAAIHERYPSEVVDHSGIFVAVMDLVSSRNLFSNLYYFEDNAIVLKDPSLPSLEV